MSSDPRLLHVDPRLLHVDPGLLAADPGHLAASSLPQLYAVPRTPWLRVNMVSTVDGAATGADGRSGSINNAVDEQVFDTLRSLADAIVVGAGTLRAEGYHPLDVPIVVVSGSGDVPERLQAAAEGQVLLATVATAPHLDAARALLGEGQVLVTGEHRVDLRRLRELLIASGLVNLLCEGGPSLLRGLLAAGVVDELCATVVPLLVAGPGPRIATGGGLDVALELGLLLEHDGTLLARWLVGPSGPAEAPRAKGA